MINTIYLDIAEKWQLGFQDEATPIAAGIIDFHNKAVCILIFIFIFVTTIMISFLSRGRGLHWFRQIKHSSSLEFIWTLLPGILLIFIGTISLRLMYSIDEVVKPQVTLKMIGAQWYWSYEINDIEGVDIQFDSYTKSVEDLLESEFRLLDVDNELYLPILTPIRLLVSSQDVIHSVFLPSLGIKMDAIPGRINHASIFLLREGKFYGQCTELCGQKHEQMSIVLNGVKSSTYLNWLYSFLDN